MMGIYSAASLAAQHEAQCILLNLLEAGVGQIDESQQNSIEVVAEVQQIKDEAAQLLEQLQLLPVLTGLLHASTFEHMRHRVVLQAWRAFKVVSGAQCLRVYSAWNTTRPTEEATDRKSVV